MQASENSSEAAVSSLSSVKAETTTIQKLHDRLADLRPARGPQTHVNSVHWAELTSEAAHLDSSGWCRDCCGADEGTPASTDNYRAPLWAEQLTHQQQHVWGKQALTNMEEG